MAFPNIVCNNTHANTSDTQSSGAGPGDGVTSGSPVTDGAGDISTDSGGTVVTIPNADLSDVLTDGSHAMYIDGGEGYRRITAKANSGTASANVTVHAAYTGTLSSQTGGIGGTRTSPWLFSVDLIVAGHQTEAGWTAEIQETGTDYLFDQTSGQANYWIFNALIGNNETPFEITGTGTIPPVVEYYYHGGSPTRDLIGTTTNSCNLSFVNLDFHMRHNGDIAHIRGQLQFKNCLFLAEGTAPAYSAAYGIRHNYNTADMQVSVINCRFEGWAASYGILMGGGVDSNRRLWITDCEFTGCKYAVAVARGYASIVGCEFWDNEIHVAVTASNSYPGHVFMAHNTLYDATGTGSVGAVQMTGSADNLFQLEIRNNIIDTCAAYGIYLPQTSGFMVVEDYNCISTTTSGAAANHTLGANSIEDTPEFVDASTQDFSLASDSPCLAVGSLGAGNRTTRVNFADMGSRQRECTGGGSGGGFF